MHFPLRLQAQLPGLSLAFPVLIFSRILMYWIPETLFSPLAIEETEAVEDDYVIPCCGRELHFFKPKSRQAPQVKYGFEIKTQVK